MNTTIFAVLLAASGLLISPRARGHCDAMDGPVVVAGKTALEKRDITPALKWIEDKHEEEGRAVFKQALAVRSQGPEAGELADRFFFETLVRLHRAGEGEPFTGLKPAGGDIGPAIRGADESLEAGSPDERIAMVTHEVETGIRKRFEAAYAKKQHADDSVAQGRDYVTVFVEYFHYVKGLHEAAEGAGMHHAKFGESPHHE